MWTMLTERSETTINWVDCEMRTQASSQKVFLSMSMALESNILYKCLCVWGRILVSPPLQICKDTIPCLPPQIVIEKDSS